MSKRLLIFLFVLLFVLNLALTGCTSNNSANNVDHNNEKEEVNDKDEEAAIEVEKKLTSVEIKIPLAWLDPNDEADIEEIKKNAMEAGVKEVVVNDDETVTYIMSRSVHKELLDEMEEGMIESIEEVINGEETQSIKNIEYGKGFTSYDVVVNVSEYENSFDAFAILGLAFQSMLYQIFDGVSPDDVKSTINIIDEETGEIFYTGVYPDALDESSEENMENDSEAFTVIKQDDSVNEEKTTGPFTVKVNKMRIATLKNNEDYDYLFMDEFQGKDTITVITLDIEVENNSSETNSIYPDQGTIVTNTKEQKEADMFFSDDVGGDFIGEVIKKGNVSFLLESEAEDITSFKYVIGGPHDEDFIYRRRYCIQLSFK